MTTMLNDPATETALTELVIEAGCKILSIAEHALEVQWKADQSPVTQADFQADQVIRAGLLAIDPETPIITEETTAADYSERQHWDRFWLVDPVDGTQSFINHGKEYTVNIGLVEAGVPVFGLIYAPALGELFVGRPGSGCKKRLITGRAMSDWQPLTAQAFPDSGQLRVIGSRAHGVPELEAYLEEQRQHTTSRSRVYPPVVRSSFAGWPKGWQMCIRDWAARWNGIRQRVMR